MRGITLLALFLAYPASARGQNDVEPDHISSGCRFTSSRSVMLLQGDCTTTRSIEIPAGATLDGNHHVIVAVDTAAGGFRGGIVVARGASASIINTTITAVLQTGVCQTGSDRLRGIYFDGASGIISGNIVDHVYRYGSACEEGNAIEARNQRGGLWSTVDIVGNVIDTYQKSGIVVHGNVDAYVYANDIGSSAAQHLIAANAVQVGGGARGSIQDNTISGNAYAGRNGTGSGILLTETAPGTLIRGNAIQGNADVGIHVRADSVVVEDNDLADSGPDGAYDVGIVNLGDGNLFANNTIRGYRTRYYGRETASPGGGRRAE